MTSDSFQRGRSQFRKGRDISWTSTCFKQFFYCCFLLMVKPKQSQSVYPFPRNSIVPISLQERENNCVWNVSRAMECRPVLVSWFLFGELLGVSQRSLHSAQSNESCFLTVVAFLFLRLSLYRAPGSNHNELVHPKGKGGGGLGGHFWCYKTPSNINEPSYKWWESPVP